MSAEQAIGHADQWFGGHTFAQHGDDLAILNLFKRIGKEQPSYMDVGAHHPFVISNTALLYKRGSRGINVEANPDLIEPFRRWRSEDINLNVGVGVASGVMKFYRTHALSGRNSFVKSAMNGMRIFDTLDIAVVTLQDIVDKHTKGRWPDLLVIDIEGMDSDALRVTEFNSNGPDVICVEPHGDTSRQMRELMHADGYFLHSWAGSNMLFVREDLWTKVL